MREVSVKEDGVILLQLSGRPERMEISNPFISKYLFPGVYLPALSQLLPAIEGAGLMLADVEILRGHYAATIQRSGASGFASIATKSNSAMGGASTGCGISGSPARKCPWNTPWSTSYSWPSVTMWCRSRMITLRGKRRGCAAWNKKDRLHRRP